MTTTKKEGLLFIITGVTVASFIVLAILLISTLIYQYQSRDATAYMPPSIYEIEAASASTDTSNIQLAKPERLKIPSLDIDAKVKEVGLTKDGAMATPGNFTDVGWYAAGTIPGDMGSAVMDGHVDNALALPGVFKDLHRTELGDDIYVIAEDGTTLHFVVSSIDSYEYDSAPTEEIFNERTAARLKLITCGGTWLSELKTYDKRVVVTADLVKRS